MKEVHLIPVGKIVRAHGVRGAVKIYPYGESLAGQDAGIKLRVGRLSRSGYAELTIQRLRGHGKFLVAEFEELTSMDEAEELIGEEVFLSEDQLPPTEEGEYYYYQLIGLSVETKEGKRIGTLRGIIETGGNDVYSVEHEGKEVLIPAVEEIICEIDLGRGLIVVDPPEGLID